MHTRSLAVAARACSTPTAEFRARIHAETSVKDAESRQPVGPRPDRRFGNYLPTHSRLPRAPEQGFSSHFNVGLINRCNFFFLFYFCFLFMNIRLTCKTFDASYYCGETVCSVQAAFVEFNTKQLATKILSNNVCHTFI